MNQKSAKWHNDSEKSRDNQQDKMTANRHTTTTKTAKQTRRAIDKIKKLLSDSKASVPWSHAEYLVGALHICANAQM